MTKDSIELEGIGSVVIRRSRQSRHLKLRITTDGKAVISAPKYAPKAMINAFVNSRQDWIKKHLPPRHLLLNDMRIGRLHLIKLVEGEKLQSRVSRNLITITKPSDLAAESPQFQAEAKKASIKALRKEAKLLLPAVVDKWVSHGAGEYKQLRIKDIKSRWGSYSSNGGFNLTLYLVQLPDKLIDYVVIHELSHSHHMNHSADFWAQVAKFCPNHKELRRELKKLRMDITPKSD